VEQDARHGRRLGAIWSLPIVHNAGQIFGYMGSDQLGRTTVLTSRIDIAHILGHDREVTASPTR